MAEATRFIREPIDGLMTVGWRLNFSFRILTNSTQNNIPSDSDKRNENSLLVCVHGKYGFMQAIVNKSKIKLY